MIWLLYYYFYYYLNVDIDCFYFSGRVRHPSRPEIVRGMFQAAKRGTKEIEEKLGRDILWFYLGVLTFWAYFV